MIGQLRDLIEDWAAGYEKDDAWTGGANAQEQAIIDLAQTSPPALDCMLYRGTGVEDGIAEALTAGPARLSPSKRLFSSWSKDVDVARRFAADAAENGYDALLIGIHSSRLELIADVDAICGPSDGSEREVLSRAKELILEPGDIVSAWKYDPTDDRSFEMEPAAFRP